MDKKFIFPAFVLLASLGLTACIVRNTSESASGEEHSSQSSESSSESGGSSSSETPDEVYKGKTILHCFDWSLSNVQANLENIKNAGFDAVQLSPLQPQKDPYSGNWRNQWWKLYQPYGFSIATQSQNILGNKNDLISLCNAAEDMGISVIMDVVCNHLASDNYIMNSKVKDFENDIYTGNLVHNTGKSCDEDVIRGNLLGLCDLQTENPIVQNRVKSMLKEYVDCGVDGFRFDAAKHIETEFDTADYKSDFWKNTLDYAKSYYESKYDSEMFSYGEILGNCGPGRKFSFFTGRMSITDSEQGSKVLQAARGDTYKVTDYYNTKEQPKNLVLWSESHDTYSNGGGESSGDDIETVQIGYLMQASRKDASVLYFARPNDNSNLGEVGDTSYKNSEVKAVNLFRNAFVGKSENISTSNGFFVNVRGSSGAAIIRLEGSSSSLEVSGLANGTYKDIITKNTYTVTNGQVSVGSSTKYLFLVGENQDIDGELPSLNYSYDEVYSGEQDITVNVSNASSVTYSINDGQFKTLESNKITLSSNLPNGKVSLVVKASNKWGTATKRAEMVKTTNLVNKQLIILDCDPTYRYFVWVWKNNEAGAWADVTVDGNMIGCDMGDKNMFIVVKHNSSQTTPTWDGKINQTENISFSQRVYSYLNLPIK